jgi:hypothetical protein
MGLKNLELDAAIHKTDFTRIDVELISKWFWLNVSILLVIIINIIIIIVVIVTDLIFNWVINTYIYNILFFYFVN